MAETGPEPGAKYCRECGTAVRWLWSPRVHKGTGSWVKFETVSEDGETIRPHHCQPLAP